MRALVVEDDFTSRRIVQKILSNFFDCDVAVDGEEALVAFEDSLENGPRYQLICLDIMMPNLDGHEALTKIRALEEKHDIHGLEGVKVIMTSGYTATSSNHPYNRANCSCLLRTR